MFSRKKKWHFVWDSLENVDATIDGVSINNGKWDGCGSSADVVEPLYGETRKYSIYQHVKDDGTIIRMAFAEQTPGVYLAFVESEDIAATVSPQSTREIRYS